MKPGGQGLFAQVRASAAKLLGSSEQVKRDTVLSTKGEQVSKWVEEAGWLELEAEMLKSITDLALFTLSLPIDDMTDAEVARKIRMIQAKATERQNLINAVRAIQYDGQEAFNRLLAEGIVN